MKNNAIMLCVIGLLTLIGNWIGYGVSPIEALPGIAIIVFVGVFGMWVSKVIPIKIESPTVVWISVIGLLITAPILPVNQWIAQATSKINFMATTTPVLAYAGLSIGKDIKLFKNLGWRIVVVSLFVLTGTFVLATLFAQIVLKLNGTI